MAAPATPNGFTVQQANRQVLISWDLTTGATSYLVQRSLDNVTFTALTTITGSPLATSYLDTAVTVGTQYWYKVAASNVDGTSQYSTSQASIPTPTAEMSLAQIRELSKQRADRVNSNFVTLSEWNGYINQAMYELYDLLITIYEDYYVATPVQFVTDGTTFLYPVPDGATTFFSGVNPNVTIPNAPALYKLLGVDLNIQNANNGYVTINKFNFIDRNRFVYPNSSSTIYGVFNMQYRTMGNNIEFIPTPSANQSIRLWYIPRLDALLNDTDLTSTGISGWNEYIIVRAAKYALDKEESPTQQLDAQLNFLKKRIEESASNRDAGQPDRISNTRTSSSVWGWGGSGYNGSSGGYAIGLFPIISSNNFTNHILSNAISSGNLLLAYAAFGIGFAYLCYLHKSKFRSWIRLTRARYFNASGLATFFNHVMNIISHSTQKKMIRINATRIITSMADTKANWNITFKYLVCNPRSYLPFTINSKATSTIRKFFSLPYPASFSFYKLTHKAFNRIFNSIFRSSHTSRLS